MHEIGTASQYRHTVTVGVEILSRAREKLEGKRKCAKTAKAKVFNSSKVHIGVAPGSTEELLEHFQLTY